MKRQRTWKEYRAIDLTLLGLALAVFEFIIVRAANWWFPGQPFTVSLGLPPAVAEGARGAVSEAFAWLRRLQAQGGGERPWE